MMTMRNTIGVMGWTMVALLAMGAADPSQAQITLYVDDSVSNSGNGLSWATAMDDVQPALTAAAAPGSTVTQIRVAQGTYKPSRRENPNNPRSVTFRLVHGVTLRGGYAGVGAPDPHDYDPESYPTILSGDLNDNDQPNFVHYGENAYHVLLAESSTVILRGVTVIGGNANGSPANHSASGGGMLVEDGEVTISNSRFLENQSEESGGAVLIAGATSVTIQRCIFQSNRSENGSGGGVFATAIDEALVEDSLFFRNTAIIAGALDIDGADVIRRCTFEDNVSNFAAGGLAMLADPGSELNSCLFVGNVTSWLGGGALLAGADVTVINCAFLRNQTGIGAGTGGGGLFVDQRVVLKNCTIAENEGSGIMLEPQSGEVIATNCIIWGNYPEQISVHDNLPPPPPEGNSGAPASISYSCVQGGWPGSHNTGVDPHFAQPGCRNFRLLAGSHYLNAGSNAAVPAGLTLDLDGQPRIQNGVVAMGAYESPNDPLPPAACAYVIPQANTVWLTPGGAINQPLEHSAIGITSAQSTANANAMLQIFDDNLHPNAGGYAALGENLRLETSIPDGEHISRIEVTFGADELGETEPLDVDATFFSAQTNQWALSVAGNLGNSPGHAGPIGDRYSAIDNGAPYVISSQLGDYGVIWNPSLQRGFVWANIDYAGDYTVGGPPQICPGDCAQPPDGQVAVADLHAVLETWGPAAPGTPADINHDGIVNVDDLLMVISGWGPCPE